MAVIEAIATTYLEADAASVTFSSIPATYEHLQVRASDRAAGASTGQAYYIEFNGSAGTAYSSHVIRAHTSTVGANALTGEAYIKIYDGIHGSSTEASEYATIIVDVLDYANTNKNTTVQLMGSQSISNTNRRVFVGSGLWDSTAAITQIKFTPSNGNMVRGSEFTLYGLNSS
jgi:hypothetical protein